MIYAQNLVVAVHQNANNLILKPMTMSNERLKHFVSFIMGAYATFQILFLDKILDRPVSILVKIILGVIVIIGWGIYIFQKDSSNVIEKIDDSKIESIKKNKKTILLVAFISAIVAFFMTLLAG